MSSVIQSLFAFPSFVERYYSTYESHIRSCTSIPANCYHCQTSKLAFGLVSGIYSVPEFKDSADKNQAGISPLMFKNLIGKDSSLFSGVRQQVIREI
jgi:ubiquitin carboxyl-terminal hydrolase 5/13